MTTEQAYRKAKKLWGKTAAVRCDEAGAFIGDDGKWHEYYSRCCEHGKTWSPAAGVPA
jgi:hypothetical protein